MYIKIKQFIKKLKLKTAYFYKQKQLIKTKMEEINIDLPNLHEFDMLDKINYFDVIIKLLHLDNNLTKNTWNDWTPEEKKNLLQIYLIFCKNENHIFNLVYNNCDCNSYNNISIFRDYNTRFLEDKAEGIEIAIENIEKNEK